jgi:23S rRNA (pseudouridine1915-N3)-methyltransferase
MRFVVAVVGKPRDAHLAAALRDYETRASRYWPLDVREVRDEPVRSGSADLAREREGERLLASIAANAQVVTCELMGRSMTSDQFAQWLQAHRERAVDVAILIGGAFGLGDVVRRRSSASLALAPWTLPHELARLVLAEQMYRAGTIVRGEPYHK